MQILRNSKRYPSIKTVSLIEKGGEATVFRIIDHLG